MYTKDMDLLFSEFDKRVVIVITIRIHRKNARQNGVKFDY